MAVGAMIPVSEYLSSAYSPDVEYVDGVLVERNLGERDHGDLQGHIYAYFLARRRRLKVFAHLEQRVQIAPTRFRVPDVCLVYGERRQEQVFLRPPHVAIEVLSPEDRLSQIVTRSKDFLTMGVLAVWVVDPATRRAWVLDGNGLHESSDGQLRVEQPPIHLPLPEIFAEIDELDSL